MEMPDFKPVVYLTNNGGLPCGSYPISELTPYHHDRILKAKDAEIAELKAMLEARGFDKI